MSSKEEIGKRIKEARNIKSRKSNEKFTQEKLASMVGISQGYLGDIERGRKPINASLLIKIADACEVPLNFFQVKGYGEIIKRRITELGLALDSVAEKSGIPIETLKKIERNEHVGLKQEIWNNLGKALNYNDDEMLWIVADDLLFRSLGPQFEKDHPNLNEVMIAAFYQIERVKLIKNKTKELSKIADNMASAERDSVIKLPIIGSFAAGQPITAIFEDDEDFPFDTKLARVDGKSIDDYFYMRVKGDSMEPNLKDGDIALIRKQPIVDNGQIAAVRCGTESVACKRVSLVNGNMTLYSDNPQYPPMIYKRDQCLIIGRIIGHYRKDY